MVRSSSLFYSVAFVALVLTAPVTARAEDRLVEHPAGAVHTLNNGAKISEIRDEKGNLIPHTIIMGKENIEKHRDQIEARRAELDAKVSAWKTAHPGEPLPAELQAHIDRVDNRLDKRDQILDKREDIRNHRVDLHNQSKAVREERKALRNERQDDRVEAKEKAKDRIDVRKDRRSERRDGRQNRAE